MSDWDASSGDEAAPTTTRPTVSAGAVPVARRKFDDEDAEEEIKDDWESSDEESKTPAKASASSSTTAVAPVRKKKSVKQKIAEKEEEERRRAQLAPLSQEAEDGVDPMDYDPIARKRALQKAEIDADVESAASLLGFASVTKDETTISLTSAKPSTKEEWEKLAADIYISVIKSQASRDGTGYAKHFVPALVRQLIAPTRDVDIRKLSTSVKTWADDKTKAEKEAKKSGGRTNLAVATAAAGGAAPGSKPKTVGTASAKNTYDLGAYGDEALDDGDDLDFM